MTDAPVTSPPPHEEERGEVRTLRRSTNGKILGGVARGLGNRFDIDANIFRVLFVVLAFMWGLGVAIYLAMWVFLPRMEGEDPQIGDRVRPEVSTSRRLSVALLLGIAVLAILAIFVLSGHVPGRIGPGFGLLWIVFLVALAIVALRTSARRMTLRRFFAIVILAVVSQLILLSGAFFGFLASTGVPISGGNGVHVWQPTSLAAVQHNYRTAFGTSTVDLSAIQFPTTGYVISASTAVGTLEVSVPANVVVNVATHVGIGWVRYSWNSSCVRCDASLPAPKLSPSQLKRAPHLTLNASVGIGHIFIVRSKENS